MASGRSYVPKAVIGQPAPAFTAQAWDNGRFRKVSLSDYAGKYVVLFFWPLDFTFVCPTEIIEYSEAAAAFAQEEGTVVLGCSIDSHFTHREWTLKSRD
jgi:alkyl hydroperoxide reductase subunit AhpC